METLTVKVLMKEKRDSLNARAIALGIEYPEKFENKRKLSEDIIKAIEAALIPKTEAAAKDGDQGKLDNFDGKNINIPKGEEKIINEVDFDGTNVSTDPVDGKVYSADIKLANEGENLNDFLDRAQVEDLGAWIDISSDSEENLSEHPFDEGVIDKLTRRLDTIEKFFEDHKELKGQNQMTPKEIKSNQTSIKKIRVELDTVFKLAESRSIITPKIEDSIFLSKSWLGKCLATLGAKNPYAGEDKVKTVKDIPPTADVAADNKFFAERQQFSLLDDLGAILSLRARLEKAITEINHLNHNIIFDDYRTHHTLYLSSTHASEAKFYLGQILIQIRS